MAAGETRRGGGGVWWYGFLSCGAWARLSFFWARSPRAWAGSRVLLTEGSRPCPACGRSLALGAGRPRGREVNRPPRRVRPKQPNPPIKSQAFPKSSSPQTVHTTRQPADVPGHTSRYPIPAAHSTSVVNLSCRPTCELEHNAPSAFVHLRTHNPPTLDSILGRSKCAQRLGPTHLISLVERE